MSDRLQRIIAAIFDGVLDRLKYYLTWSYQVQAIDPGPPVTMHLTSNDSRMPDCELTLWPGPSGAWSTPPVGATVRVQFVAGDPAQPMIVGTDPYNPPTTVTLAGGGPAVGRVGDAIEISVQQFADALPVANLSTGAVTITNPMEGSIKSGSGKVNSG